MGGVDAEREKALQTAADASAEPHLRKAALAALAKFPCPEALATAVAALAEPVLHDDAVWLLKKLSSDDARNALLGRLEQDPAPEDYAELSALSDLGWDSPWPVEAARRAAAILRRVVERGPKGASAQALYTATSSLSALKALSALPDCERAELARSLERAALDPDEDVTVMHRYGAISALLALNTPAAVPILERCLDTGNAQDRAHARQALLRLDFPEARRVVVDRGLRGTVLGPLALFAALHVAGIAAAASALSYLFGAPWPLSLGVALVAALPAIPSLLHYASGWRRADLWTYAFLYGLYSPAVLSLAGAVCLEVWRDWGWAGHLLAAALVLAALLNLLVYFARALAAKP
ncbi:MAG: HEAT repeat domain-containing protein [Myxococcales bacterium]